ncbi:SAM hydrolase/SAM-dependent halogenase family protein [Aerococcus urinae]
MGIDFSKVPAFRQQLVFQSDFGLNDGAVSAMTGVVVTVDESLSIHHLTHNIPPYDIYLAGYRLYQTYSYWPQGTIFVSIVDPGVGYQQKSVIALLDSGHYIVTPNNGTLSFLAKYVGIKAVWEIDKEKNLLPSTNQSYTFYGRDLYAYTAARLSSGQLQLSEVGEEVAMSELTLFDIADYQINREQGLLSGHIAIHDERFGSLWTNIPYDSLQDLAVKTGDKLHLQIHHQGQTVYDDLVPVVQSFQSVPQSRALIYCNSLKNLAVALNQNSFAQAYKVGYGPDWQVTFQKSQ